MLLCSVPFHTHSMLVSQISHLSLVSRYDFLMIFHNVSQNMTSIHQYIMKSSKQMYVVFCLFQVSYLSKMRKHSESSSSVFPVWSSFNCCTIMTKNSSKSMVPLPEEVGGKETEWEVKRGEVSEQMLQCEMMNWEEGACRVSVQESLCCLFREVQFNS